MSTFDFARLDPEQLLNQVTASMERDLGEILNPGDERRIVAHIILSALVDFDNRVMDLARGQLWEYATGSMQDELGRLIGLERHQASPAIVLMQFDMSAPAGVTIEIPAGTRVTADAQRFFATANTIIASYDTPTAEVVAAATDVGADHNGYPVGSINVVVDIDAAPYVTGCRNISVSQGGTGVEDDEDFRARGRGAPGHFSTAGPTEAYIYWALTADAGIGDVEAESPEPKHVVLTVLMRDGSAPSQAILDKVYAAASPDNRRPLSDLVTVQAPTEVSYTVSGAYYIAEADAEKELVIQTAVQGAYGEYLAWQSAKLGRAINPDELRKRVLAAGAVRFDMTSPDYTAIGKNEVPRISGGSSVAFGGII